MTAKSDSGLAKAGTDAADDSAQNQLNSPELDEKLKPTRKAIETYGQAHSIAKSIRQRAVEGRIKTGAVILDKYNGSAPFIQADLVKNNQGWRNNFSTNYFSSVVDRVKPQVIDPINNVDVLTRSQLPPDVERSSEKSRDFQETTTKTVRRWEGWPDFLSMLVQETCVFGVATPGWLDDNWRPRVYQFHESYLPEGTGQHSKKVQVWVVLQRMMIHEFLDLIRDPEAAAGAGYDREGCVKAANESATGNNKDESPMDRQDAAREGSYTTYSYENQTKTIDLYHVLVREYDGGVALWTMTQKNGHKVRHVEDLHCSMEDALTLFSMQSGNTKFYGSKGIGRLIVNLHIAIERNRNIFLDLLYLSGLPIIHINQKTANNFQPIVRSPFIILDEGITMATEKIEVSQEAWLAVDQKLSEIAESIAGAFIPPNLEGGGSSRTKIEAAQKAQREMAVRQGVLGRIFTCFAHLMNAIQRKIYSKENLSEAKRLFDEENDKKASGIRLVAKAVWKIIQSMIKPGDKVEQASESKIADAEAVQACLALLRKGLTVEEIAMLALAPSAQEEAASGDDKDNNTIQFIQNNMMSPMQNQREAYKLSGEIMIGQDRTNRLLIPDEDPNIQAIAVRQQTMENSEMLDSNPMPVASTDNHIIHRAILAKALMPVMQGIEQGGAATTGMVSFADLACQHYMQHLQMDKISDQNGVQMETKGIQQWMRMIEKIKALHQQMIAAGQDPDAQLPPEAQGKQPVQAGPNGEMVGQPDHETEMQQAELQLRAGDQALRAHDQSLKERAQEHKEKMDHLKATTDATKLVADHVMSSARAGQEDMQAMLQQVQDIGNTAAAANVTEPPLQ